MGGIIQTKEMSNYGLERTVVNDIRVSCRKRFSLLLMVSLNQAQITVTNKSMTFETI